MIDIHHHCLPGVDDGPATMEQAVALCHAAAEDGIETIIATPHVLRGRWESKAPRELHAKAAELRAHVGERPRILLGSEYFFAHDVTETLAAANAIVPLAGSHYVLLEFVAHAMPPLVEQPLYRMQLEGWMPIIAHPERNAAMQAKPELLVSLVRLGVKTQITCGSFTGDFGEKARKCAIDWLQAGLVHFVATDAHNVEKRPPRAKAALAVIADVAGEAVARAITRDNPQCVIEDRALDYEPEPAAPARSKGLLNRLGQLFRSS